MDERFDTWGEIWVYGGLGITMLWYGITGAMKIAKMANLSDVILMYLLGIWSLFCLIGGWLLQW